MHQKVRWYSIQPFGRKDLEGISSGCLRDEFLETRDWGFQIQVSTKSHLEGRFIEKNQITQKVLDPFGKTLEFQRVDYRSLSFRLAFGPCNMEVYDAPASLLATFFNQLAQYRDFGIAIVPVEMDVLSWLIAIQTQASDLVVRGIVITDLSLSTTIQAQVSLSGSEDVRASVATMTGGRKCQIHKATFEAKNSYPDFKCEVSSLGRAHLMRGADTSTLTLIRRSIMQVASLPIR